MQCLSSVWNASLGVEGDLAHRSLIGFRLDEITRVARPDYVTYLGLQGCDARHSSIGAARILKAERRHILLNPAL